MPKRKFTYDPACEILASHFLSDEKGFTRKQVQLLSDTIQSAVEDWIIYSEDGPRYGDKTFAEARAFVRRHITAESD
jgi:hypothetical protein